VFTVELEKVELGGRAPRAVLLFRDEGGAEAARITLYWHQVKLFAKYKGSREGAERLASILRAMGGEAAARQYGGSWYVVLTTNQVLAVRDPAWAGAVRQFLDKLRQAGAIDEARHKSLVGRLEEAGAPTLAGVRFAVSIEKSGRLSAVHKPRSEARFAEAVERLRGYGLAEGLHFTAGRTPSGRFYIRLTRLGLLEVARRAGAGDPEAARFIKQLRQKAGELGVADAVPPPASRRLPLAVNTGGAAAVVKKLAAEIDAGRLRITAEYESAGAPGALAITFRWEKTTGGYAARAEVRVSDPTKAAILKALVGDYPATRGKAKLTMRHLERLREFEGIAQVVDSWLATKNQ
jgi:hypothetical protein